MAGAGSGSWPCRSSDDRSSDDRWSSRCGSSGRSARERRVPGLLGTGDRERRPLAEPPRLGLADRPGPRAVDQPGRRRGGGRAVAGGQVRRGRAPESDRPRVRRSSLAGTPAATSRARAWSKVGMPGVRGRVARDGQVRPVAQDRPDQRGEDRAGADLDEDPGPVAMHRLDHRGEPDRAGEVLAEPGGDRLRVGRVRARVEVRIDRAVGARRRSSTRRRRVSGPLAPATFERVEGPGDRQGSGPEAGLPGPLDGPFDPARRPGDDGLPRPVLVDGDHPVEPLDQPGDLVEPAEIAAIEPGSSPSASSISRPRSWASRPGLDRERPGGVERDQLAEAVAGDDVGLDPERLQEPEQADRRRAQAPAGRRRSQRSAPASRGLVEACGEDERADPRAGPSASRAASKSSNASRTSGTPSPGRRASRAPATLAREQEGDALARGTAAILR